MNGRLIAGLAPRVQSQLLQQPAGPLRSSVGQHIIERIQPLPGFNYFLAVRFALSHF